MKKKLGRPSKGVRQISITLPENLIEKLDEYGNETLRDRSNLIAEAVKNYFSEGTVYGTYRLPGGNWQTVAIFDNVVEAFNILLFHAQGRGILISDTIKHLKKLEDYK